MSMKIVSNSSLWLISILLCCVFCQSQSYTIGEDATLPADERQVNPRVVTWHPVDGQEVHLNPPRFRWPYRMDTPVLKEHVPTGTRWTLQIAADANFGEILFEAPDSDVNFFNAIPPMHGAERYYWRVQERRPDGHQLWSGIRNFSIAADAQEWDRSNMLDRSLWPREHPRLYWNANNWDRIQNLHKTDDHSRQVHDQILAQAERTLQASWWKNFPKDDKDPKTNYFSICKSVLIVGLAQKLTGDKQYSGHKERMLQMAAWPPGQGYSSPEGMPPTREKWSTHLNEELALYYDWFYHDMTAAERTVIRNSLEWRLRHTLWSFCFSRKEGTRVEERGLMTRGTSHEFQNSMISLTGCLAIWDELPDAEKGLESMLHYVTGVTAPFGVVEGQNEGPGYGNGKTTWLADAVWAVRTALPHVQIERLPQLTDLINFFNRITPVGLEHASFGNRGFKEYDWSGRRYSGNLLLGYLTGNRQAIANAQSTANRLREIGSIPGAYSPWTGYVLPFYAERPEPELEQDPVHLWPVAGWITAGTQSPSDYARWNENVGMTFTARPYGRYSHSFGNENAFDLYAYGQVLAHGGGGTQNRDHFPNSSMSHNTVLIDGQGQVTDRSDRQWSARIAAFRQNSDYVYWAGDATPAYAAESGMQSFLRHVVFMRGQYFVLFDDLQADRPVTWQWLYHLNKEAGLQTHGAADFDLQVEDVRMQVRHLAQTDNLTIENRPGDTGRVNLITGEDYSFAVGLKNASRLTEDMKYAQHIWVSTRRPTQSHQFLTVLFPSRTNESAGTIERLSDRAVAVTLPDGTRDIITFGEQRPDATVSVDVDAIRNAAESVRSDF